MNRNFPEGRDVKDEYEKAGIHRAGIGYGPIDQPPAYEGLPICTLTDRAMSARSTLHDALATIMRLEMRIYGVTPGASAPIGASKDPGAMPPLAEHIEGIEALAGEIHGRLVQLGERL